MIERRHWRHHVDDGLCAEPGYSGAAVMLQLICDVAEDEAQAIALMREMLGP